MATETTPNLGLTTVEADDRLPEAAVNDNFDKIDAYVGASAMTNKSGAQRVAGEVVVADTTADSSFTTTTTANDSKIVGVVQETIADDASGIIKHHGPSLVKVTGATSRGDWLITSTTEGQADPDSSSAPPSGAFAIALTATGGAGTVTAMLVITAAGGTIILPSSTTPTPTAEGQIEWDSDNDRIVVGNGSGQTTFFSGAIPSADLLTMLMGEKKGAFGLGNDQTTDVTVSTNTTWTTTDYPDKVVVCDVLTIAASVKLTLRGGPWFIFCNELVFGDASSHIGADGPDGGASVTYDGDDIEGATVVNGSARAQGGCGGGAVAIFATTVSGSNGTISADGGDAFRDTDNAGSNDADDGEGAIDGLLYNATVSSVLPRGAYYGRGGNGNGANGGYAGGAGQDAGTGGAAGGSGFGGGGGDATGGNGDGAQPTITPTPATVFLMMLVDRARGGGGGGARVSTVGSANAAGGGGGGAALLFADVLDATPTVRANGGLEATPTNSADGAAGFAEIVEV